MPVADLADVSRRDGVYAAVLAALEDEVNRLTGLRFPVATRFAANVDAMRAGQAVDVSAGYVPASARPRLEPGNPMLQATIRPDDTVTFSQQTAVGWLGEAGL
jgi:hypothetical protein